MDAPPAPPSAAAPRPAMTPQEKRARHYLRVRVATWATIIAVVGSLAYFAIRILPDIVNPQTKAEAEAEGCATFLDGIANYVKKFEKKWDRMPKTLVELRQDPEETVTIDPQPWDCWKTPIQYRVVDEDKRTFRLRSLGPDKLPDTKDDILWPGGATWK